MDLHLHTYSAVGHLSLLFILGNDCTMYWLYYSSNCQQSIAIVVININGNSCLGTIMMMLRHCNKIFIITAEYNGFSSAAHGYGILHAEWKIFAKI